MDGMGHFIRHLLRCSTWAVLMVVTLPWPPVAAAMFAGLYFATFAFFHDAAHGALGLPQRVNDIVLFITSGPLFMSAHGQRQLHLRHHAHPLDADDLEGAGALVSLWWAALTAPMASVHMRVASFSAVPAKIKPWVAAENVLNAAVAVVVVASGNAGLHAALAMAVALHLTMNAWASHVPHRAPQWLLKAAAHFAWTGSPVVLSLVYHLEHHAQPRLPCALLRPADNVDSPLIVAAAAHPEPLPWAQLQVADRPRPRVRGSSLLALARK